MNACLTRCTFPSSFLVWKGVEEMNIKPLQTYVKNKNLLVYFSNQSQFFTFSKQLTIHAMFLHFQ